MAKTPFTDQRIAFDLVVVDAMLGTVTLNVYGTTSTLISPGLYLYDVQVKYAAGPTLMLLKGEATITERISRFYGESETSPFYQPDQVIDGGTP